MAVLRWCLLMTSTFAKRKAGRGLWSRGDPRYFELTQAEIDRRTARKERLDRYQAMGRWLETYEWQAFFTGTFREREVYDAQMHCTLQVPQTNVRFAKRVFDKFRHLLNLHYCGRHYRKRKCKLQIYEAIERQVRGAAHAHWLIAGLPDGWRYQKLHECWAKAQALCGLVPGRGWAKPYPKTAEEQRRKLSEYVCKLAKYVIKDNDAELWNLYGFDTHLVRGPSWAICPGTPFERKKRTLTTRAEKQRPRLDLYHRALDRLAAKQNFQAN